MCKSGIAAAAAVVAGCGYDYVWESVFISNGFLATQPEPEPPPLKEIKGIKRDGFTKRHGPPRMVRW